MGCFICRISKTNVTYKIEKTKEKDFKFRKSLSALSSSEGIKVVKNGNGFQHTNTLKFYAEDNLFNISKSGLRKKYNANNEKKSIFFFVCL